MVGLLGDFGLAERITEAEGSGIISRMSAPGTKGYFAADVLPGARSKSNSFSFSSGSDVYSFGMAMAVTVTGNDTQTIASCARDFYNASHGHSKR